MKKKVVRFQGGFANQLFQLCMYLKIKEEFPNDDVLADLSCYNEVKAHGGYRLSKYVKLKEYKKQKNDRLIVVNEHNYDYIGCWLDKDVCFDGYWQKESFFPKDMSIVLTMFEKIHLKGDNLERLNIIKSSASVSIHVRRGDYVDHYLHGNIATKTYYQNAIEYIKGRFEKPHFFVFSDDIEWCKKNLSFGNSEHFFVEGNQNDEIVDLYLMSKCRHNIIANSSFSWWAQWLNDNREKSVIMPRYWYNQELGIEGLKVENAIELNNIPIVNDAVANPFFSILIPLYNKENEIRRCLSSILNQAFWNFEVIIVDDGSYDRSAEIVKEYSLLDKRISVICKEKNESLLAARISAMKQAKGEYICFVDADDYVSGDYCDTLYNYVKNYDVDVVEYAYICEPNKEIVKDNICNEEDIIASFLNNTCNHTLWNKCYSINVIKNALNVMEAFYCNMSEDLYFSTIFAWYYKECKSIEKVLYHYNTIGGITHGGDITEERLRKHINSVKLVHRHLEKFINENRSELLHDLEKHMIIDANYLKEMCDDIAQDIEDRMSLYHIIDNEFGTNYIEQYKKALGKAMQLYNNIYDRGKYNGLKMIIKSVKDLLFQ